MVSKNIIELAIKSPNPLKFLIQNNFKSKRILGPKNLGQKDFGAKINWSTKFLIPKVKEFVLIQKNVWPKTILLQKFLVKLDFYTQFAS